MEDESEIKKVNFKKRKFQARKRIDDDEKEEDEDTEFSAKLEEAKQLQRLRERSRGVDIVELTQGPQTAPKESNNDPFKVKSGGMVNMKSVQLKQSNDDAYDVGIGTQFSAETNKRDEDEEMMKYIEDQLTKQKKQDDVEGEGERSLIYHSPEDAALQDIPEHLRASSTTRSEEMLSNQMLSGIPEVDLGIECKIKNIEATEEAKLRLLWEQRNKKDGPSQFVPSNMAVNFANSGKINTHEEVTRPKKREPPVEPSKPGEKREKASDDMHYERFKKQFRRY